MRPIARRSDTAALSGLVKSILDAVRDAADEGSSAVRCLKDPTRDGVATALNETDAQSQVGVTIHEAERLGSTAFREGCSWLTFVRHGHR